MPIDVNVRRLVRLLTAGLAVCTLVGCTGDPPSRTGGTTDPASLVAVYGQGPTSVGGDVLDQLVSGTHAAAVRVTVDSPPRAGDTADERHAVEAVRAGDADLTVVRAGVLQQLGAQSLAPLGVPFVVTDNDQAAAVAADAKLSEQLFSELGALGLVGLGLVPGGLRHPFGYGSEPLLGADDYRGQTINVREDAGVAAILERLAAHPDHSVDDERNSRAGKTLRGIEASVQQIQALTLPAVQTVNVTLYEKFDVGVASRATWDGLGTRQRAELASSFQQAARAATALRVTEQQGQANWCRTPLAASVLATGAELASLRDALAPIAATVAADPAAARTLDRMRELGAGTVAPTPTPTPCTGGALESADGYRVTSRGDQSVLDGLWRLEVDEQALLDAGVPPHDARINAGVWEFRITAGYADGVQPDGRACNGQFVFDGPAVSVDFGVDGVDTCGGLALGTYRLDGDRVLFDWQKELEYDVLLDRAMFAAGMVRIG